MLFDWLVVFQSLFIKNRIALNKIIFFRYTNSKYFDSINYRGFYIWSYLNIVMSFVGNHGNYLKNNKTLIGNHLRVTGNNNTITGNHNTIIGNNNTICGNHCNVTGNNNKLTGNHAFINGNNNSAKGSFINSRGVPALNAISSSSLRTMRKGTRSS